MSLEPTLDLTLACGGATHRLRLDGADLMLLDHANLPAEQVFASLGGDTPACVRVLAGWEKACSSWEYQYSLRGDATDGLEIVLPPEPEDGRPEPPEHAELYDQAWTHALVARLPRAVAARLTRP